MKRSLLAAALAATSLGLFAQYQDPGPRSGARPGSGMGGGVVRLGGSITPGWALMSAQERKEHQERMRSMKDRAECEAYVTEHYKRMQERATAQGKALPPAQPTERSCQFVRP